VCADGVGRGSTDKGVKKREEDASRKLILESTKKCPGCQRAIEKSWGCDHMTCKCAACRIERGRCNVCVGSRCKKEFCWQCLAPYKKKGVRGVEHRQGCQYYDPHRYPDSGE
jgi:hypothetical protein